MFEDPTLTALGLALILVAARFGGRLAQRIGQPAVLGELLAGIALGQLQLLQVVTSDPALAMLGELGVILLLFEVGLESTLPQMLKVGGPSLRVATIGVLAPLALGFAASKALLPNASPYTHLFLGAVLTATSVGITARVLAELGRANSDEARVIVGAAVIDDVLGLLVLSVVTAVITAANSGNVLSAFGLGLTLLKAVAFLGGAAVLGRWLAPFIFGLAARARALLLLVGLSFCFGLAFLSHLAGLAPIVGAFVAGLVLEPSHYATAGSDALSDDPLHRLVKPISKHVAPVFFVLMGMHTDVHAFVQPGVLALAGALICAAILGKQACYFVVGRKDLDRLSIAIGMIPRGEVGLIFANVGLALRIGEAPVIDGAAYAAIIAMVLVTTLLTPPALKWSFARGAHMH